MIIPTQQREDELRRRGIVFVAGCDEAGRGAWAGPLVAAAVILPEHADIPGLRDSKTITEKKRELLYDAVIANALAWNVAVFPVEHIDEHGVHVTNKEALRRAALDLSIPAQHLLVDGFDIQPCSIPTTPIVDGDATELCIAAASILAKVTRDRIMRELDVEFPHYGFAQHKGYGTALHRNALERFGITPHHRTSFAPIRMFVV